MLSFLNSLFQILLKYQYGGPQWAICYAPLGFHKIQIHVVTQERRRIVNPQRGKYSSPQTNKQSKPQLGETRRNPQDGISGNRKSQIRSELEPNGINSEVPGGKFQQRFELAPKGINSKAPAKEKSKPQEGISGDFHSQGRSDLATKGGDNFYIVYNFYVDTSWRQKEIIPKCQRENFAPVGKFLRSVQFLRRSEFCASGKILSSVQFLRGSELAQKELIPRCQRDISTPTEFEILIWVWNFGRKVEYTKIQKKRISSLLGSIFLPSRRSGNNTEVLRF